MISTSLNFIYNAVISSLEQSLQEEAKKYSDSFKKELEFDERFISLKEVRDKYPNDCGINIAITEFVEYETSRNCGPRFLSFDEKSIIRGKLELLKNDIEKYTLEEIVSLVR